jgi:hypothetical protein
VAAYKSFRARNVDKATALLREVYGPDARYDRFGERNGFDVQFISAVFGKTRVTEVKVESWSVIKPTHGFAHVAIPLGCLLRQDRGTERIEARAGAEGVVGRPHETITLATVRGRKLSLLAPIDDLVEYAVSLTGRSFDRSLMDRMAESIDLTTPLAATLARSMRRAIQDVASLSAVGMRQLVLSGFDDLLLSLAAPCLFLEVANLVAKRRHIAGRWQSAERVII